MQTHKRKTSTGSSDVIFYSCTLLRAKNSSPIPRCYFPRFSFTPLTVALSSSARQMDSLSPTQQPTPASWEVMRKPSDLLFLQAERAHCPQLILQETPLHSLSLLVALHGGCSISLMSFLCGELKTGRVTSR